MALENTDVFPIYRGSDAAPHRKATIGALLTRIGEIPTSIDDLIDVDTDSVNDGEMLVWNDGDSKWEPTNMIDGGEYAS